MKTSVKSKIIFPDIWSVFACTVTYANEHGSDSARFEHGGGSRSNTKGGYVVLDCQKHYLRT